MNKTFSYDSINRTCGNHNEQVVLPRVMSCNEPGNQHLITRLSFTVASWVLGEVHLSTCQQSCQQKGNHFHYP